MEKKGSIMDKNGEFKMNLQLFSQKEDNEEPEDLEDNEIKEEEEEEKTLEEIILEKEKEWETKAQAEADRRVNQALDKFKKEQEEKERIAKLSEEERIKELEKKKEEELLEREKEINLKDSKLNIIMKLKEENLLDVDVLFNPGNYVGENKDKLDEDIVKIKEAIKERVSKEVEGFKSEYLKGGTPPKENPNKGNKPIVDNTNPLSIIQNLFEE